MKRFAIQSALVVGTWTALGLIAAGSIYVRQVASGAASARFLPLAQEMVLDYWVWAALTPLVFVIARALPFTRGVMARSALLHCVACVGCSLLHVALAEVLHISDVVPRGYHGPELLGRWLVNFYSDIWMYWPIVGLWNLLDYQKKFRERETRAAQLQVQLANAQLQALRNQLHPHFLFNTLNSISALMQDDSEGAEDMLADLSYMLRGALDGGASQEITLAQELDLLAAYFRIQSRRFADRLSVQIDVTPQALEAMVPTLLLQPIAENAIQHGIAPLTRPAHICVRGFRKDHALVIQIADDGRGLANQYREGIGLSNTRERLRQLYGDKQSLRLENGLQGGVIATIELPFRVSEERSEDLGYPHADRGRRAFGSPAPPVAAHD